MVCASVSGYKYICSKFITAPMIHDRGSDMIREVPSITTYIILESSSPAHLLAAYLQDFKSPLSCWKLNSTNSLVRDFPVLQVICIKEYVKARKRVENTRAV